MRLVCVAVDRILCHFPRCSTEDVGQVRCIRGWSDSQTERKSAFYNEQIENFSTIFCCYSMKPVQKLMCTHLTRYRRNTYDAQS